MFLRKITFNTLASAGGRIAGGLLALVSVGFITRALGVDGFGEYSTVVAYLSTFQILADLGLYQLLTKEIAQNPERESELVGNFFTLRLVVAALFLIVAGFLVFLFPYSEAVQFGAVFAAAGFLFLSLSQVFLGVFQKYVQVYKAAISEVVGRAAQLAVVWYFFTRGGTLFHFLGALVVSSFVMFLLNLLFARRLAPFRLRVSKKEWRRILKTTLPIAVSLVFTLLYFRLDTLLLSVLKTQRDVGIYSAAYKVLETLIFFPAAFVGLMLPTLSRLVKENREKLSRLLGGLTDVMTISALPLVAGGLLLAAPIVFYIGGADFLVSQSPLRVLMVAVGIIFYGTLFGNAVIALGLQKKAMAAYIAGFILNLGLNLIFIPRFSFMGAAWTTAITELFVTAWLVWLVYKHQKFRVSFPVTLKAALAAAVMGGTLFVFLPSLSDSLSVVHFAVFTLTGIAIYAGLAFIFNLRKPLRVIRGV